MFDSSMSAAAIAARIQELQAAAGIKAQLVNPSGRGAGIITLTGWVALAALVSSPSLSPHVCASASSWSSPTAVAPASSHSPAGSPWLPWCAPNISCTLL